MISSVDPTGEHNSIPRPYLLFIHGPLLFCILQVFHLQLSRIHISMINASLDFIIPMSWRIIEIVTLHAHRKVVLDWCCTGLCCLCLYPCGDVALSRRCLQFDCLLSLLGIVFCTRTVVEARAPAWWFPLSYIYEQSSSNNRQYSVLWPGAETIL
jgi:hypothetical protein